MALNHVFDEHDTGRKGKGKDAGLKIIVFIENIQHGGLDTFCATLINAWPDAGDSFTVVCNESHPGLKVLRSSIARETAFLIHGIPLSWVLSGRLFGWLPASLRRLAQPLFRLILYPFQYLALRRVFRHLGGDALISVNGGFPGGETCRIANIAWAGVASTAAVKRNVHNFHSMAVAPRWGLSWYENWVDRKLRRSISTIVSVSSFCAKSLQARPMFRDSSLISYVYNGIDATGDDTALPDLRKELQISRSAPLCLILANYEPHKGHKFLFRAFARVAAAIPDAHLVACGGGSKEAMEAIKAARDEVAPKAAIHLLGFVPGGAGLIEQADVLAISSQSFESFGLTAVEAMRRGVPVVSTRVGGLPEVVGEEGEGGYVVAPDDVAGFANHLIALLGDAGLRQRLGELGRQRALSLFTAGRMAVEYHKILSAPSNATNDAADAETSRRSAIALSNAALND